MFNVSDSKVDVSLQEATSLFNAADFAPFDPTQEVIFPPELMVNNTHNNTQHHQIKVKLAAACWFVIVLNKYLLTSHKSLWEV